MSEDAFWNLIRETTAARPEDQCATLASRLAELPVEAIHVFSYRWDTAVRAAYTWKLWGAAYLIGGGASDDGFAYFRDWLVLQGREVYKAAVADPDSLVTVATDPEGDYEAECYPDLDAWTAATGKDDLDEFGAENARTLDALGGDRSRGPAESEPAGDEWDFDSRSENARRLPQLTRLYWPDS